MCFRKTWRKKWLLFNIYFNFRRAFLSVISLPLLAGLWTTVNVFLHQIPWALLTLVVYLSASFQPLCVSGQQARLSRSAFLHRPPLHEHHLGALRPLRHLPDSGHQRLPGGLQHLPHPLRWRQRRLLHQGENCYRAWRRAWWFVQVTSATADKTWNQRTDWVRWIYQNNTDFLTNIVHLSGSLCSSRDGSSSLTWNVPHRISSILIGAS